MIEIQAMFPVMVTAKLDAVKDLLRMLSLFSS